MEISPEINVKETTVPASADDEATLWKTAQEENATKTLALHKVNEASLLIQSKLAPLQKAVAKAKEAEQIARVK
eukprot:6933210-Ditylum_brightwellii.AAC.1